MLYGEFTDLTSQHSAGHLDWAEKEKGGNIGKRLARALKRSLPTSLEDGIEYYHEWRKPDVFPGEIKIFNREQAEIVARNHEDEAYYTDGS